MVTGGSSGIGAMITRGFVENGVKTYITARKLEQLQQTAAELSILGESIAIQSDLSTMAGLDALQMRYLKEHLKSTFSSIMLMQPGEPRLRNFQKQDGTR